MRARIGAIAAAIALCGAAPAGAAPVAVAAGGEHRVCSRWAPLYEVPGELVVGAVTKGQRVRARAKTVNGRWLHVRSPFGTIGWIAKRHLCGR